MVIVYSYGIDFEAINTALKNYLGSKYVGLSISGSGYIEVTLSEDLTDQEKATIKDRIEDFNFRKLTRREE